LPSVLYFRKLNAMNCPNCGKEMEPGALQVALDPKIGGGARWFREGERRNRLGTGGEQLPLLPFMWDEMSGYMCRDCRLLVLSWPGSEEREEDNVPSSRLSPFSIPE
jgi:hypothetical protein